MRGPRVGATLSVVGCYINHQCLARPHLRVAVSEWRELLGSEFKTGMKEKAKKKKRMKEEKRKTKKKKKEERKKKGRKRNSRRIPSGPETCQAPPPLRDEVLCKTRRAARRRPGHSPKLLALVDGRAE
jgi:hypothetical protein